MAIPAMQLDPSKWTGQVTYLKRFHAKINLFHKILGGSKTEVEVEGLPHGHLDNLETSCFVLPFFSNVLRLSLVF